MTDEFTVPADGTYYLNFDQFNNTAPAMAMGALPSHMADQYSFRVVQP